MLNKRFKNVLGCVVSVAILGISSFPVFAHHGWTWYGNDAFELTAKVVEVDFGNPHDRLVLEDAQGQRWNVLLSPPGRTRSAGLNAEMVKAGDTVTAYGHRRSEGDNFEMKTERLQIGDTLYNLYPDRS